MSTHNFLQSSPTFNFFFCLKGWSLGGLIIIWFGYDVPQIIELRDSEKE